MSSIPESPKKRRQHLPRPSKIQDASRKWCPQCEMYVPRTDFEKHNRARDGLGKYCRYCAGVRSALTYDQRIRRATHIRTKYGLTLKEYDDMMEGQGHACAICKSPDHNGRNWHIDHDHDTGKVRGILCHGCNNALGSMKDSSTILRAAADYLERHGK